LSEALLRHVAVRIVDDQDGLGVIDQIASSALQAVERVYLSGDSLRVSVAADGKDGGSSGSRVVKDVGWTQVERATGDICILSGQEGLR
jgi:hypothetical protein